MMYVLIKVLHKQGILLKTIFNLLHNNYLTLSYFIIKEEEKSTENNLLNKEYIIKLKNIIKNNIKLDLSMDENNILNIIGNNLKQVNNYYKMIIDNLYSYFYLKKIIQKIILI